MKAVAKLEDFWMVYKNEPPKRVRGYVHKDVVFIRTNPRSGPGVQAKYQIYDRAALSTTPEAAVKAAVPMPGYAVDHSDKVIACFLFYLNGARVATDKEGTRLYYRDLFATKAAALAFAVARLRTQRQGMVYSLAQCTKVLRKQEALLAKAKRGSRRKR